MSQVSPHGGMWSPPSNDPGAELTDYARRNSRKTSLMLNYVANFKDYRFLQVFYPTRGILAWL